MAGFFNWLSQVASVTKFGLLGIPQRRGSVAAAVMGIAGVVAVLVGVLSISAGFDRAMRNSGSTDTAVVLRTGADTEMVSGLSREQTRIIADAPGLAKTEQGPLASAELFVIINLPMLSSGTDANVPLRGVEPAAFKVRERVKMIQGRPFEWGKNEVIVGRGAATEFAGLHVGSTLKVGRLEWSVVGMFEAGGGVAESEIWTDARVLQSAYKRGETYQSVYARLIAPTAFAQFTNAVMNDPRLNVRVLRQNEFYEEQSTAVTKLITTLGTLVSLLMAVGAVFGALNTMYSAVSARAREIATLRALGFGAGSVVASVMLEAVLLALIGGAFGGAVAYFGFNGFQTATINWQSFSQVTFSLHVTRELLVRGITWAVLIGMIGGLLPAIRAARLPIAAALREL